MSALSFYPPKGFPGLLSCWLPLAFALLSTAVAQQPAQENQLVVIRTGNDVKVFRATKVENKGDFSNIYEETGKKSIWQTALIVKSHPLFLPAQTESYTEEQANLAIADLQKIQEMFPQAKLIASAEIDLWKAFISERSRILQERRLKLEKDLQEYFAGPYQDGFEYTKEALRAKIEQGEALMQAAPEKKADLEIFLSPWRRHLEHLEQNHIRIDGVWATREEIAEREEAVRLAEEEKIIGEVSQLEIPVLVVPQTSVLLVLGFVLLGLISILYLFLHLASSRGGNLSFGGAIMLLAGLSLLGFYAYSAYLLFAAPATLDEVPEITSGKPDPDTQKTLQRVLYLSARPSNPKMAPADIKPSVKDEALNRYLKEHLKFVSSEPSQFFDMQRNGVAVRFEPHRITLYEETACLGKAMLIRYEVFCSQTEEQIQFSTVQVKLGNAPLPGSMSTYLWKRFKSAVDGLLNGKSVNQTYQLDEIENGSVTLAYSPRFVDRAMTQPLPGQSAPLPGASPEPKTGAAEEQPEAENATPTPPAADSTQSAPETNPAESTPAAEAPMN